MSLLPTQLAAASQHIPAKCVVSSQAHSQTALSFPNWELVQLELHSRATLTQIQYLSKCHAKSLQFQVVFYHILPYLNIWQINQQVPAGQALLVWARWTLVRKRKLKKENKKLRSKVTPWIRRRYRIRSRRTWCCISLSLGPVFFGQFKQQKLSNAIDTCPNYSKLMGCTCAPNLHRLHDLVPILLPLLADLSPRSTRRQKWNIFEQLSAEHLPVICKNLEGNETVESLAICGHCAMFNRFLK